MSKIVVGVPLKNNTLHTHEYIRICAKQMAIDKDNGADYTGITPQVDLSNCEYIPHKDNSIDQNSICEHCHMPIHLLSKSSIYSEQKIITVGNVQLCLYNTDGNSITIKDTHDMNSVFIVGMELPNSIVNDTITIYTRLNKSFETIKNNVTEALKEVGVWREGFLGIYIIPD